MIVINLCSLRHSFLLLSLHAAVNIACCLLWWVVVASVVLLRVVVASMILLQLGPNCINVVTSTVPLIASILVWSGIQN